MGFSLQKFDKLVKYSNTKDGKRIKVRVTTVNQITNALHIADFWRYMHEYQMQHDRGIAMSTNQLVEPSYYSMAYAPHWLREGTGSKDYEIPKQVLEIHHILQTTRKPLLEVINFAKHTNTNTMNKLCAYVEVQKIR